MKKIISLMLLLTAGAGILLSARVVDRMAVAYLTGQRRVVGEGFLGENLPNDGPVPGYLSLGFTRPSENPKGMVIRRPREMARELGLAPGDVVTEVDGKNFTSSQDLMSHLVRTTQAGQTLSLTAVTPGRNRASSRSRCVLSFATRVISTCPTRTWRSARTVATCCKVGSYRLPRGAMVEWVSSSTGPRRRVSKHSTGGRSTGIDEATAC